MACHQFAFLEKIDVLEYAAPGAHLPAQRPVRTDEVWDQLPREVQELRSSRRSSRFYTIDAPEVAREAGMSGPHQHDHADLLLRALGRAARDEAIAKIKKRHREDLRQEGRGGRSSRNWAAVDAALDHLHEVEVPDAPTTATATGRPSSPTRRPTSSRR